MQSELEESQMSNLMKFLENFELLKDVENGKYEDERAYAIPSLPSVGFGELKGVLSIGT